MRVPTFVVAGAARSGTTALVETLRAHPEVFVTRPKEPHFLALAGERVDYRGPGDDATINRVAVTDEAAYLGLFPADPGAYAALGEGSVSTLYLHQHAIPTIRRVNPDLRVLVVLRDPVERMYSSWQYLRSRGHEPCADFLEAVAREPDRIAAGWHHLWHYAGMSRYAAQVAAFLDVLGPDQVRVLMYDDLEHDPAGTTAAAMRFVGADPRRAAAATPGRVNASGRPRSAGLHDALLWMQRRPALRAAVKRAVPFGLRERIRNADLQPRALPGPIRAELAPLFTDETAALAEVLGRAPSWATGAAR